MQRMLQIEGRGEKQATVAGVQREYPGQSGADAGPGQHTRIDQRLTRLGRQPRLVPREDGQGHCTGRQHWPRPARPSGVGAERKRHDHREDTGRQPARSCHIQPRTGRLRPAGQPPGRKSEHGQPGRDIDQEDRPPPGPEQVRTDQDPAEHLARRHPGRQH
jgi:hypothetical protein